MLSRGFLSASSRLPLGFPSAFLQSGQSELKPRGTDGATQKSPTMFFCGRAILTPPFFDVPPKGALHRWSHRWRGAGRPMRFKFFGCFKHAIYRWSHRSRQQNTNDCNASLAFQKTQSTDGATDGEVLTDRGDPNFVVLKKGSLPMEPPMERVGDRAIVLPRGVQKVRPSDFDATRPSDFDATLGRWSLPPCLPRQSTLPSQVGCYLASQQAKDHPQPSALARRNARSD